MLYGSCAFNANISGSSIPVTISNKQHQNLAEFNHFINTYWVYFFSNKQYLISFLQSPHSDYVTRCYFNLCLQQGSRDDRVSRDVFSFLYV